jgi:hypothetical protein
MAPPIQTSAIMDNHHKMVDFAKYISIENYGG